MEVSLVPIVQKFTDMLVPVSITPNMNVAKNPPIRVQYKDVFIKLKGKLV